MYVPFLLCRWWVLVVVVVAVVDGAFLSRNYVPDNRQSDTIPLPNLNFTAGSLDIYHSIESINKLQAPQSFPFIPDLNHTSYWFVFTYEGTLWPSQSVNETTFFFKFDDGLVMEIDDVVVNYWWYTTLETRIEQAKIRLNSSKTNYSFTLHIFQAWDTATFEITSAIPFTYVIQRTVRRLINPWALLGYLENTPHYLLSFGSNVSTSPIQPQVSLWEGFITSTRTDQYTIQVQAVNYMSCGLLVLIDDVPVMNMINYDFWTSPPLHSFAMQSQAKYKMKLVYSCGSYQWNSSCLFLEDSSSSVLLDDSAISPSLDFSNSHLAVLTKTPLTVSGSIYIKTFEITVGANVTIVGSVVATNLSVIGTLYGQNCTTQTLNLQIPSSFVKMSGCITINNTIVMESQHYFLELAGNYTLLESPCLTNQHIDYRKLPVTNQCKSQDVISSSSGIFFTLVDKCANPNSPGGVAIWVWIVVGIVLLLTVVGLVSIRIFILKRDQRLTKQLEEVKVIQEKEMST